MKKETKINSAEYQAPEIQVINVEMEGVIAASGDGVMSINNWEEDPDIL